MGRRTPDGELRDVPEETVPSAASADAAEGPAEAQDLPARSVAPDRYMVAAGVSVSCLRGMVESGQPIAARDLGPGDDGEAALADLVAGGAIQKQT